MPHITVTGCDTRRQMQEINIHAHVIFNRQMHNTPKAEARLKELTEKLETLLSEYFDGDSISSEEYSNHEWNTRMRNY
jgi:hypothetical protein